MTEFTEDAVNRAVKAFIDGWEEDNDLFFNAQDKYKSVFELFLAATKYPELYNSHLNWSKAAKQVIKGGVHLSDDAFGTFYERAGGNPNMDMDFEFFEEVTQEELDFIDQVFNRLAHPIDFTKQKLEDYK